MPSTDEKVVPIYEGVSFLSEDLYEERIRMNKHKDEDDDEDDDFVDEIIKETVNNSFGVITNDELSYYTVKGEKAYITLNFYNPDQYEILSFVLNGVKYQTFQFTEDSNAEAITVGVTIPETSGVFEYYIEQIKYIDGTTIKDCKMEGNQSIKIGIGYDMTPNADSKVEVSYDNLTIDTTIIDSAKVVENSNGEFKIFVFDENGVLVDCQPIKLGKNNAHFKKLEVNTKYYYVIATSYDAFDGEGPKTDILDQGEVVTKSCVEIANQTVTTNSISFDISKELDDITIVETNLYLGDKLVETSTNHNVKFSNLYSDTLYKVSVKYIYNDEEYLFDAEYTTLKMMAPAVNLEVISEKASVEYNVVVSDENNLFNLTKVEILKDEVTVESKDGLNGTFTNLQSNTTYVVKVTYSYDLNNGLGIVSEEISKEIITKELSLPTYGLNYTKTDLSIEGEVIVLDTDNTSTLTSINLYRTKDEVLVNSATTNEFAFAISPNTSYTIVINYEYDLRDGLGKQAGTYTFNFYSSKIIPTFEIIQLSLTSNLMEFDLDINDFSLCGEVKNIYLYKDTEIVKKVSLTDYELTDLLSNTSYKLVVDYAYDLEDGLGVRTITKEFEFTTLKENPTIIVENTVVTEQSIKVNPTVVDPDNAGTLSKVELYLNNNLVDSQTENYLFSGLLSNTKYEVRCYYTYNINLGEAEMVVSKEITTSRLEAPTVAVELNSSKNSISYKVLIGSATIANIELIKDDVVVNTAYDLEDVFENVLSNNNYTVKVNYTYDLNDGNGVSSSYITKNISTKAYTIPSLGISTTSLTDKEIAGQLVIEDPDNLFNLISISLYQNGTLISTVSSGLNYSFTVQPNVTYQIKVTYAYDLNDGNGQVVETYEKELTSYKEIPVVSINAYYVSTNEVYYDLFISDVNNVGHVRSIRLYENDSYVKDLNQYENALYNLNSNTEYKIVSVYVYDLDDGLGSREVTYEYEFMTLKHNPEYYLSADSTARSITISHNVIDPDSALTYKYTRVYLSDELIAEYNDMDIVEFDNLLSNNQYRIEVGFVCDINNGEFDYVRSISIYTQPLNSPYVNIEASATKKEILFEYTYDDFDKVIVSKEVYLLLNGEERLELEALNGKFTNLLSDNYYQLVVAMLCDFNDGRGEVEVLYTTELYTLPLEAPTVDLEFTSTPNSITFNEEVIDTDNIFEFESVEVYLLDELVIKLTDINEKTVNGTTINNLVSGTYRVYYDGSSIELERVEGSKTYYISFDGGTTYHEMFLNQDNNNYEEYLLTDVSLASDVTSVMVKDDLDNVETFTVDFKAGLNTINFAIDNQRRKENNYEVFVNIKSTLDENAMKVTLHYEEDSKVYYLPSSATNLPKFTEVFTLENYQTFVGWYNESTFENVYSTIENDGNYYAKVLAEDEYLYISSKYDVTYDENVVDRILLSSAPDTITFTVESDENPIKVFANDVELTLNNGVYSVAKSSLTTLPATIIVVETVTVSFHDLDGAEANYVVPEDYLYEAGTYSVLPLPTAPDSANFKYYYDRSTGIVYTDNTGRLISPHLIKDDIQLTPFYSDEYYVTVNKYLPNGTVESQSTLVNDETVVSTFPRVEGYHYNNVVAYQTTNGYPIELDINEYLHTYSFDMPKANVVINVTYVANSIEAASSAGACDTIYVLVPTAMAKEVLIYDSVAGQYVSMVKLPASMQIYPNYIAYKTVVDGEGNPSFDLGNKYFKVKANGYESYYYALQTSEEKFVNNLFIIDNLSLEDEVCYPTNWISYEQNKNVYTLNNTTGEYTDVYAIHGKIEYDSVNKKVTIVEAVSVDTFSYYQYASFIVTYKFEDTFTSYLVTYTADGTENNPILIDSGNTFNQYLANTKFRYSSGKHFLQTVDGISVDDANGYKVIYDQDKPFNHIYDGNNLTLNYIQSEIRDHVNNGLFGYIGYSGQVLNLKLNYSLTDQNSTYGYETKYYLGSVASINLGTIDNVVTSEYTISANNVRYVGGIVAHNVGTIDNCTNNITIKLYNYGAAESRILGGIAGYNGGTISNSVNNAEVSLSGETGREQYVEGIAGMNKGTISNSCSTVELYNYEKDKSGTYSVMINGVTYPMYHNPSSTDATVTKEYLVNGVTLAVNDEIIFYKNGSSVGITTVLSSATSLTYSQTGKDYNYDSYHVTKVTKAPSGKVDIYFKEMTSGAYNIYIGNANIYTLKVSGADGERIIPMNVNYGADAGVSEFMAISVDVRNNDTVSVCLNGTPVTLTGVSGQFTTVTSGKVNVGNKNGSYDFYYKTSGKTLFVGQDSGGPQQVNSQTIKVVLVDDWYFIEELKDTPYGLYYFETAMRVEYYNGNTYLGDMIYNNAQTYDYEDMSTVIVDILAGTTKIKVSRLMLISSRETGQERWYYAYDGNSFTKLGNEMTSYPENTYTTTVNLADITDDVLFIYALTSGNRYETATSLVTTVDTVSGEVDTVNYVDVTYSTDVTLGSFRIKYYNGNELIAVRSYVDGEQIKFLNNVTSMRIEQIEEGSGVRKVCDVTPDVTKTVIQFAPELHSVVLGTPSDYDLSINDVKQDMYINSTNSNEVMAVSVDLKENDTVYVVDPYGSNITTATLDPYSVKTITYNEGMITTTTAGLYDIYYNTVKNTIYISNAVIYELVLCDNSGNKVLDGSGKEISYKMYPNPSPIYPNELMSIGVSIGSGQTLRLRRAGDVSYITEFTLDSTVATLSNGIISFAVAQSYDLFLHIDEKGVVIYCESSDVDNFTYNYDGATTNNVVAIDSANYSETVSFVNTITGYNTDYSTRVYYLDNSGNYLVDGSGNAYYYEFTTATASIPVVDGAKRLRIVRYQEKTVGETTIYIEINEVYVNAIYPSKTITLSMPYYGYYDISYASSVTDQQGLYLESVLSGETVTKAYLNYELNDGRTGRITMINNHGKFYVPFDSVIGLNPLNISFTYLTESGSTTTDNRMLFTVSGDTIYSISDLGLEATPYTTYTPIYLYVDTALCPWNEYFILVDDTSYNLMSRAGVYQLNEKDYYLYVAYVHGSSFKLATSPDNTVVFKSTTEASTFIMDSLITDEVITGFAINTTEQYNYFYYLETETNGLLDTHFGLFEYGEYYIGMHHLAEEVSYYVVDGEGAKLSNTITSGEGNHLFIYDPSNSTLSTVRNETDYTVTFMYGGNKERVKYNNGEIVKHDVISQRSTIKYDFEFAGWSYSGKTYLVDTADDNKLYYLDNNDQVVYLYAVDNMTITPVFTPVIKKFTLTLLNPDGSTFETSEVAYGEKVSSSDFSESNIPTDYTAETAKFVGWFINGDKKIIATNYPITQDTTLYPKWHIKGVFLVGVIEGYTAWDDQRDGYQFNDDPEDTNNKYDLQNIYLEAGDEVKPRIFNISTDDDWYSNWAGLPSGNVCEVSNTNLKINNNGYYSFYIQDSGAIYVTYQEYMIIYEFDNNEYVEQTTKDWDSDPTWRFSIDGSGTEYGGGDEIYLSSFKLYSEEDARMGLPSGAKVTTPTLQRSTDEGVEVIQGWYTRPFNGERVSEVTEDLITKKNSLTLYPNYILGGYYLVNDGVETRITQNEATTNPLGLTRYKEGDKVTINYYNGSVGNPTGVSTLDATKIEFEEYAPNISISGNTITFNQDGLYDFYVTTETDVDTHITTFYLHVEQYHEIIYTFSDRINPTIGSSRAVIVSGSVFIQKYGDPLAIVTQPNVVNNSGVIVKFENWIEENDYQVRQQIVTHNATYYPQYDVANHIHGANFTSDSAPWNMAMIELDEAVPLTTNAHALIVEVRFNIQDEEGIESLDLSYDEAQMKKFWFRLCATDTDGIIYDAFGKEITDKATYPDGYWYSVNTGTYTSKRRYNWYTPEWGGWNPAWDTDVPPTYYVEVPLGFFFARFNADGTAFDAEREDNWLSYPGNSLQALGIHVCGNGNVDFTIGRTFLRYDDESVVELSNPGNYSSTDEVGKDKIISFKVDTHGIDAGSLNTTLFKPIVNNGLVYNGSKEASYNSANNTYTFNIFANAGDELRLEYNDLELSKTNTGITGDFSTATYGVTGNVFYQKDDEPGIFHCAGTGMYSVTYNATSRKLTFNNLELICTTRYNGTTNETPVKDYATPNADGTYTFEFEYSQSWGYVFLTYDGVELNESNTTYPSYPTGLYYDNGGIYCNNNAEALGRYVLTYNPITNTITIVAA